MDGMAPPNRSGRSVDEEKKLTKSNRAGKVLTVVGVVLMGVFTLASSVFLALAGAGLSSMGGELEAMSPTVDEVARWNLARGQFATGWLMLIGVAVGALLVVVAHPRRWLRVVLWAAACVALPAVVYVIAWVSQLG